MSSRLVVASFACLPLVAAALPAQVCTGNASFRSGAMRVGASADFGDKTRAFSGQFAVGQPVGLFAGASVGAVTIQDVSGSGTVVAAAAGYSADLRPDGKAQLCPIASFAYQSGPDVDTGFGTASVSAHSFGFGGSIGGIVASSPTMDLVPFAGAQYVHATASGSIAGFSSSSSDDYGNIAFGAGIVFNHIFTLRPSVAFPVGLEGGTPVYSVAFTVSFGATARR